MAGFPTFQPGGNTASAEDRGTETIATCGCRRRLDLRAVSWLAGALLWTLISQLVAAPDGSTGTLAPATASSAPVAAGEDKRDWWSFRPLRRPSVPETGTSHPVDAFLRAKLREHGLGFSAEADRRTLFRRLGFDLTGLPPAYPEVEAFVADPDPAAY